MSSRKTMWGFMIRASSCLLTLFLYHLEADVYASLKITWSPLKIPFAKMHGYYLQLDCKCIVCL